MADDPRVKIVIEGDASSAVQAGQNAEAMLAKVREQIKGASDETDAYNKWLQKNATQLGAHSQGVAAAQAELARYEATLKRMNEEQERASQLPAPDTFKPSAVKQLLEHSIASQKAADETMGLSRATRDNIEAITGAEKSVDKLSISKKNLKDAINGLATEFPLLGSVARMALNPITLAVAGIAAGFAIFRDRVEGLKNTLAGIQLPDLSPPDPKQVDVNKEAWDNLANAIGKAIAKYNSAEESSERTSKRIAEEYEYRKKILELMKQGELAGANTPAEREAIEQRYSSASSVEDKLHARKVEAETLREIVNLTIEAEAKERIAAQAKITSDRNIADLEAQKAAAMEQQAEAKKRQQNIPESNMEALMHPFQDYENTKRYGAFVSFDKARAMEQETIDQAQVIIDRANKFSTDEREKQREALNEAARLRGLAASKQAGLPDLRRDTATSFARDERIDILQQLNRDESRIRSALGTAEKGGDKQIVEVLHRIMATIEKIDPMKANKKYLAPIEGRLAAVERQLQNNPR